MQDAKMPTLSRTMRETLVKGEQLTDEHIDLAQRFLKKQFHHLDGLQPPVLSQRNGFTSVQHKAIQIHHVPGHWVTQAALGEILLSMKVVIWVHLLRTN